MKKQSWLVVALLCGVLTAWGQSSHINVVKAAGGKVGVDLSGIQVSGAAAQTARRTLELDIARSGWLTVAPKGGGSVIVSGTLTEAGGAVVFTCQAVNPAGQAYLNATYTQPANQAIYLAHQVAHDLLGKVMNKPSFFLAKLVMVGTRSGAKELYLADSSLQDIRQVTQDKSVAIKPRWSPDNRFISYTSFLKRYPDVYTIEMATGNRTHAASFPGVNSGGAISPNGRSMALILSKDGNPDLYVMDIASKRLTRLTNTPRADEGSPAWSPDGSRIVYVSNASGSPQLYIISASGGAPQRLTRSGSQNVAPDWGQNGLIAYQTQSGGKFQIAVVDPNIMQERVITPFDASYEDPSWAPDGRHLVAVRGVNYSYSLYLLDYMAEMGDKPIALTTTGDWTGPAWSN